MVFYILKRVFWVIPMLLGMTLIVFTLSHIIPGDPVATALGPLATKAAVERLKEAWRLNDPLPIQYLRYVKQMAKGDLGFSVYTRRPVTSDIKKYFMATFELSTVSLLIAMVGGIVLGAISAARKNGILDFMVRPLSLFGMSMPVFWVGLLILLLFYYGLGVIPIGRRIGLFIDPPTRITGMYMVDSLLTGNWTALGSAIHHVIGPALCLALCPLAIIARQTRSNLLEVLDEDYIGTARAKGMSEGIVVLKHALRNALLPIVTITGIQYGYLLGSSVMAEVIFSWPGIGRYALAAIRHLDFQPVLGVSVVMALVYMLVNLVVDVSYVYINPKVRFS